MAETIFKCANDECGNELTADEVMAASTRWANGETPPDENANFSLMRSQLDSSASTVKLTARLSCGKCGGAMPAVRTPSAKEAKEAAAVEDAP